MMRLLERPGFNSTQNLCRSDSAVKGACLAEEHRGNLSVWRQQGLGEGPSILE
jgi:hypothetical protein